MVQRRSGDYFFRANAHKDITAVVVKSQVPGDFFVNDQSDAIPLDPDVDFYTYFISLSGWNRSVEIKSEVQDYDLFLIFSDSPPLHEKRQSSMDDVCTPVDVVHQDVWRAGLTAPSYSRSFHDVEHHIVHHSAGSNTNVNYTQVVRDIYIYHTQVNNWSDIGYNYLVSQDGTVFAGRDPGSGLQDKVRGAHFCGKNTGTLGICLLGNYEEVLPEPVMIESLENILVRSIGDLGFDPFSEASHNGKALERIAGHRDGCSTLCPGAHVYAVLDEIRSSVADGIEACLDRELSIAWEKTTDKVGEVFNVHNNSYGYTEYAWLAPGGEIVENESSISITYPVSGIYGVGIVGLSHHLRDTLFYPEVFEISGGEELVVYPNPVSRLDLIHLDLQGDYTVALMDISGRQFRYWDQSPRELELAGLYAGIYILKFNTKEGVETRRIIVQ